MGQEIVLISDVPGLGQLGEVRKVKNGYANNYLIPNKLAVLATPNILKRFEKQKEKHETERQERLKGAKGLGDKLSKATLLFERPIGPGGSLYGSVTPHDIVTELGKQGVSIDKKSVLLQTALKTVGTHLIRVRLHSQVVVELNLTIKALELVSKSSEATAKAENEEATSA